VAEIRGDQGPQIEGKSKVIYILDTDVFTLCELPDSKEYLRLHAHVLELDSEDRVVTSIVSRKNKPEVGLPTPPNRAKHRTRSGRMTDSRSIF
jgi:hypothetical protein